LGSSFSGRGQAPKEKIDSIPSWGGVCHRGGEKRELLGPLEISTCALGSVLREGFQCYFIWGNNLWKIGFDREEERRKKWPPIMGLASQNARGDLKLTLIYHKVEFLLRRERRPARGEAIYEGGRSLSVLTPDGMSFWEKRGEVQGNRHKEKIPHLPQHLRGRRGKKEKGGVLMRRKKLPGYTNRKHPLWEQKRGCMERRAQPS